MGTQKTGPYLLDAVEDLQGAPHLYRRQGPAQKPHHAGRSTSPQLYAGTASAPHPVALEMPPAKPAFLICDRLGYCNVDGMRCFLLPVRAKAPNTLGFPMVAFVVKVWLEMAWYGYSDGAVLIFRRCLSLFENKYGTR